MEKETQERFSSTNESHKLINFLPFPYNMNLWHHHPVNKNINSILFSMFALAKDILGWVPNHIQLSWKPLPPSNIGNAL